MPKVVVATRGAADLASEKEPYRDPPPSPFLDTSELASWSLYRAAVAEFMATLMFLYVSLATVIGYKSQSAAADACTGVGYLGVAWSFGATIMVLVYCTGGVSGGHINPAVTLALLVCRKLTLARAALYVAAQCLGAICGAAVVKGVMGRSYEALGGGANAVADGFSVGGALAAEVAGTFVLVYVVLSATDPKRTARDSFIPVLVPLPIGFAVFVVHLATIPITGTGINPARSLGAAVMYNQHKAWKDHEDLIVPSVPSQPVSSPISAAPSPSPASASPTPLSVAAGAPSPQNGSTIQPDLFWHGSRHGGNSGGKGHMVNNGGDKSGNGSNRSRSTGNNSGDGNSTSGGDVNWNDASFGGGININSSVHSASISSHIHIGGSNINSSVHTGGNNLNSNVHTSGSNLNSSFHSGNISGSGIDSSRRMLGGNNWNGNSRGGVGSNDNGNGGDSSSRNNGGRGSGHWSNYGRNSSGSSNGGGRGGRNRRDHDRGANFSPRNYSRVLSVQQQQQGFYQPGPFQRPPPPPATHFMMPQPFGPYVPPYAYLGDVQTYPLYVTPFEQQFQNMHLIQQTMQPLVAQQDQLNLQHDIQHQIEYYFSTNNLCRDTYLRERMDDQGWVPIDLIATFPMCIRFTMLGVDTNYILDSLRGSELLEVQGNNIRRRNDWAAWLLRRGPPPSN